MPETPEWLREKIRAYYSETTETSYLASWAGESLGFHLGVADDTSVTRDESLLALNELVASRAKIARGERVLDAGCGVGGSSIWLAQHRHASVTGITIEPRQVELATRFAAERGVTDRARFACTDFAATGFAHASFDVVWNVESLCHAADPETYLAHVRDLLAPGGRFACADFFAGDRGDAAHCRVMREGWVLPSLRRARDIAKALEALGFVDVIVEDLAPRVRLSADALRAMAERRLFVLRVERDLAGMENAIYEAHARAGVAAADGLADGSIDYGYIGARCPG